MQSVLEAITSFLQVTFWCEIFLRYFKYTILNSTKVC